MYSQVDCRLWDDNWVRKLSPCEKLLFIYLLTNPNRNMLGLYVLPRLYAQDGTQLSGEQFDIAWDSLIASGKIIYDTTARMVFVKNYLRFNPLRSNTQLKGALKKLHELSETRLFRELLSSVSEMCKHVDVEGKTIQSKFPNEVETLLKAIELRVEAWEE